LAGGELDFGLSDSELPAEMFTRRRPDVREGRDSFGYRAIENVAIVPVMGGLVHRGGMNPDSTVLRGYQGITREISDALQDSDIDRILLHIDSPGGEASGAFELAEMIREANEQKPVIAAIDGLGASAAYLIASAASEIAITPSGYAGSIGVVTRHADFSKAMDEAGIKVTHIHAGAHKVDGNPYEPLPDSVRADFQAEIDALYQQFVSAVAAGRGLTDEHVRGTQARIFRAQAAVDSRLVDRIATPDQLITELTGQRARSVFTGPRAQATHQSGAAAMTIETADAGATKEPAQPKADAFTQTDIDKARAEGVEQGKQAEADRTKGILAIADEKGADMAVAHTCISQGLSVEQAGAFLENAPKATVLSSTQESPGLAHSPEGNDLGPDAPAGDPAQDEHKAAASAVGFLFGGNRRASH
ncbi:MAG: S49 family peptidase, partial [Guyparkeria sp.]